MFRRGVAQGYLGLEFKPDDPWTSDVQTMRGRKFQAVEGRSDLMSVRLDEVQAVANLFFETHGVPVALACSVALAYYLRGSCRRRGVYDWMGILDQAVEDGTSLLHDNSLQRIFALAEQG